MKHWRIITLLGLMLLAGIGITSWLIKVHYWDALEAFMTVALSLSGITLFVVLFHFWKNPDSF